MQAGGSHLRPPSKRAGARKQEREREMMDQDERRIAHPVALALWLAFLACLALAVVLLPIYAIP